MVFLLQYVHERSQISKANIVRTFWGITQIVIWCYLKIIIKKVIANRWITLNFHNWLFPWQPFWWFTHKVSPYQLYTSPYHLAPKYWRKLSLMRQYPRITKFPSSYLKWHATTETVAMVFSPQHVHWIVSFWKADSHRNILSYYTCCYLVLPLNYAKKCFDI